MSLCQGFSNILIPLLSKTDKGPLLSTVLNGLTAGELCGHFDDKICI